jgi:prepilin-type N-terminal cleavage/methylation domain-containing protein
MGAERNCMKNGMTLRGLTLVELLMVVFVLAAIAAIGVPRFSQSAELAKSNRCDTNVCTINAAIEMYAADNHGFYPADQLELKKIILDNPLCFPEGTPMCPLGGIYQYDPISKRVFCTHFDKK